MRECFRLAIWRSNQRCRITPSYVRSPEAWMLNGFVLPVEQFDAARKFVSQFDPSHPLRVAALGPKTANAEAFLDALERCEHGDSFILEIRCRS